VDTVENYKSYTQGYPQAKVLLYIIKIKLSTVSTIPITTTTIFLNR